MYVYNIWEQAMMGFFCGWLDSKHQLTNIWGCRTDWAEYGYFLFDSHGSSGGSLNTCVWGTHSGISSWEGARISTESVNGCSNMCKVQKVTVWIFTCRPAGPRQSRPPKRHNSNVSSSNPPTTTASASVARVMSLDSGSAAQQAINRWSIQIYVLKKRSIHLHLLPCTVSRHFTFVSWLSHGKT